MKIIYTGTPPSIKAGGIAFIQGQPTEVPEMVAELLLKKPFFEKQGPGSGVQGPEKSKAFGSTGPRSLDPGPLRQAQGAALALDPIINPEKGD